MYIVMSSIYKFAVLLLFKYVFNFSSLLFEGGMSFSVACP